MFKMVSRLGFVPSLLVQSYASSVNVGEVSERARLLLDDHMLDSKSDDDFRGCAFVSTVASSVIEDSVESSLGALFARTAVSQRVPFCAVRCYRTSESVRR